MLLRMVADPTVWLGLLLVIVSPINSVAGGYDFTFDPSSVSLAAVIGTETATQAVRVTNVKRKSDPNQQHYHRTRFQRIQRNR